uniref:Uncharacterized protein n=1 Tax=Fagus sylvatica TaxID=28930 RepID=A0A2N9ET71_FAGSY
MTNLTSLNSVTLFSLSSIRVLHLSTTDSLSPPSVFLSPPRRFPAPTEPTTPHHTTLQTSLAETPFLNKTQPPALANRDHRSTAHGWQRKRFAEAVQGQRRRSMPVLLVARDDSGGICAELVRSRSSRTTRQRRWLLVVLDLGRSHLLSSRSPRVTVVSAFSDLHQNFQGFALPVVLLRDLLVFSFEKGVGFC